MLSAKDRQNFRNKMLDTTVESIVFDFLNEAKYKRKIKQIKQITFSKAIDMVVEVWPDNNKIHDRINKVKDEMRKRYPNCIFRTFICPAGIKKRKKKS